MSDNLSEFERKLLRAIHDSGAEPGKPFTTTVRSLATSAGDPFCNRETLIQALRSLVTNGVSSEKDGTFYVGSFLASAEITGDSEITIKIGAPRSFISDLS